MIRNFSNISLLIIAGGKSSRMKQDKRLIEINGTQLLEHLLIKASKENFSEIILCVEEILPFIKNLSNKYNATIVVDKVKNSGAISGLTEGLKSIKTDWALALSCDMPFFEFQVVTPLLSHLDDSKVVMFEHQPLAAFYHNSMAESFSEALNEGILKLRNIIEKVPHKILKLNSGDSFFNVNTPTDLRLARGRAANINRKVPIISVIAPSSGTGKTIFIEKLISKLNELGINVGVLKSDAHGFNLDIEGKDSWRFSQAGAKSVAVISPKSWLMIQETERRADFSQIADKMENIDLILTESRSHATLPAISLYRGLDVPLINESVVAIFTNEKIDIDNILQCDLNDVDQALKVCLFLMGSVYI